MKKSPCEKNAWTTYVRSVIMGDCFCVNDARFVIAFGSGIRGEEPRDAYFLAAFDPLPGENCLSLFNDNNTRIDASRVNDTLNVTNSPDGSYWRKRKGRLDWNPRDGNPNGGVVDVKEFPWITLEDGAVMTVKSDWRVVPNLKMWSATYFIYCSFNAFLKSFKPGNLDSFAMEVGKKFTVVRKMGGSPPTAPGKMEETKQRRNSAWAALWQAAKANGWEWK